MATQRAGVIGTLVFGVICALAGYFAAFEWGTPILDKAEASVNWPQVAGRIEIAELQQARDSDGNRLYRAQIDYSYQVAGAHYRGSRIRFDGGPSSSSAAEAKRVLNRYQPQQPIEVHYNPQSPEESVLEPGTTLDSYLPYFIGLTFFTIGVLISVGMLLKLLLVGGVIVGALLQRWKQRATPPPPPKG